jgi:hypothetical protein
LPQKQGQGQPKPTKKWIKEYASYQIPPLKNELSLKLIMVFQNFKLERPDHRRIGSMDALPNDLIKLPQVVPCDVTQPFRAEESGLKP